ncbi:hypothetical protein AB1Y20_014323 [Prymnesium parvum]|uniref:histone deacetylase n=1 Tax=Prymnesium parvum TaxID=97485 RepID=A0AB34IGQ3_PRYPA
MGSSSAASPADLKLLAPDDRSPSHAGDKRKLPPAAHFKFPSLQEQTPTPSFRPPPLFLDVHAVEEADSPLLPRTPANVRSVRTTKLHEMVSAADVDGAAATLAEGHSIDVQEEHGFTPLHRAAALPHAAPRLALVALLLRHRADVHRRDGEGYSCLHWAAACGHDDALAALLDEGAELAARSAEGETPLHRAARLGRAACARALLARGGAALVGARNARGETALDVAGKVGGRINRTVRGLIRKALLEAAPAARTVVLHHSDCSLHLTGDHHQEHPLRIEAILAHITHTATQRESTREHSSPGGGAHHSTRGSPSSSGTSRTPATLDLPSYEVTVLSDFPLAPVDALLRVHEAKYVGMVQAAALKLQQGPPHSPVPFTPMVQQARGAATAALKDPKTCDTRLSAGSYAAARRAAGAVICAIDQVLAGEARNALCIVRPPGHHAGSNGLIPGSVSCGFCVFNSVMIGASHALHSERARRVAVVDFDVHHGDGSEDIVRKLAPDLPPSALFFASIHLYDPGDATYGAFYPSSGGADSMVENIINVPIAPLWRRAGAPKAAGRLLSSAATGASPRCTSCWGCGRAEWRNAFSQRILPALRAFSPDLLLLSSGFDGACNDIGNSMLDAKEKYHQGLDLGAADFEWATEQLVSISMICCPGKVVSVLEGGYGAYEYSKTSATGYEVSREQLAENVGQHLVALTGAHGSK